MSIHPVMSDAEVKYLVSAIDQLAEEHKTWAMDYVYDVNTNEFHHKSDLKVEEELVDKWFSMLH